MGILTRLRIGSNKDTYMPVYVKEQDRYLNVLVVGGPGTGKSVSLTNWWFMDSLFPCSKIAIDPSGFLAKDLYSISKGKAIYCSIEHPVSLNPLVQNYTPIQKADDLIEIVNQVVKLTSDNNKELTVKMREFATRGTLYCLENGRNSIEAIRDWLKVQRGDSETRDGIIARLNVFLQDDIKPIVCGSEAINWQKFIDSGRTLILDCKGMSRDKMIFTGCLLTHAIKSYFRYSTVKEYSPLLLYVDEAHNFLNQNHFDILKEGRKYKLSCILATQDLATLEKIDRSLLRMMLSNIGTLIAFRCGYREASYLAREFSTLELQEIQFLEKYHCAYRTPEEEGIAKSQRPLFVKELPVRAKRMEDRTFDPKWFALEPLEDSR